MFFSYSLISVIKTFGWSVYRLERPRGTCLTHLKTVGYLTETKT